MFELFKSDPVLWTTVLTIVISAAARGLVWLARNKIISLPKSPTGERDRLKRIEASLEKLIEIVNRFAKTQTKLSAAQRKTRDRAIRVLHSSEMSAEDIGALLSCSTQVVKKVIK